VKHVLKKFSSSIFIIFHNSEYCVDLTTLWSIREMIVEDINHVNEWSGGLTLNQTTLNQTTSNRTIWNKTNWNRTSSNQTTLNQTTSNPTTLNNYELNNFEWNNCKRNNSESNNFKLSSTSNCEEHFSLLFVYYLILTYLFDLDQWFSTFFGSRHPLRI